MFVSKSKTAQQFRDEVAKDLRDGAEREQRSSAFKFGNKREQAVSQARYWAYMRYAEFLESIQFE